MADEIIDGHGQKQWVSNRHLRDMKELKNEMKGGQEIGHKDDKGKPVLSLLPPKALFEVGKVLTHGALHYGEQNWRHLANYRTRFMSAALRHIFTYLDGQTTDEEMNLPHLAAAVTSLLFILELDLENSK